MLLDRVCLDIMYCIEISEVKTGCINGRVTSQALANGLAKCTLAPCVPLLREVGLKFARTLIRGNRFHVEALIGT